MLDFEQCWQAVEERDASQDGRFIFGVMTTGIFCRPACPARLPLRKNVRFFETPEEAESLGFRPCLRCKPRADASMGPNEEKIQSICRYIEEHSEDALNLEDLSRRAGLSSFHFQRSFKSVVGLTPRQFLEAARIKKLKTSLRTSKNVTDALYDVGFGSSSRVYERADTRLGMTPGQYRRGGEGVNITCITVASPVGLMMIGATDRGLCFLQFGDTRGKLLEALMKEYPQAELHERLAPFSAELQRWIDALSKHLDGKQPRLDLPMDIRATAFQMRVWRYLQSIPYGEVQSYTEVAEGIGQPKAVRAVAQACAKNVVALVIPCHRVIRGTGELGGYRWGLDRKRALLDRERSKKASAR